MGDDGKNLRVGIVGAGWVSAYHLIGWSKQAGRAKVVAIADPSLENARARVTGLGNVAIYDSAEAMLAATELDIVDICAPREVHERLVRLAAGAGLAVICQKPLAPTFSAAEALVASLPATPLMVHENWRFRAYYRQLKRWLDDGMAGRLTQVDFAFLSSGMIHDGTGQRPALVRQPFFATQHRLLVMEVLIHHLDTLRFLLGEMEVVAARLGRSNDAIVAEDSAAIVLRRLADGMLITITGNLAVHGAPAAPADHLRIFGSDGTIRLTGTDLSFDGAVPQHKSFDAATSYQGAYDATIAHFLDGLVTGYFETAPEDNLKTLALVEAIYDHAGLVLPPPANSARI